MYKGYDQLPRFNAAGLATASILALIVAMAISVTFDIQPVANPAGSQAARSVPSHA